MTGAGKPLAFEVISIRRHTEASGPAQRPTTTPNEFRSIGLPLISIFQIAYVPANQSGVLSGDLILGGPEWFRADTYDIAAKVDEADLADWRRPEMTQTMLHAMLQAMLAERFKVVVHHESKEMPVYDLVVAKGGPKFKQAETVDAAALEQKPGGGGMMFGTGVRAIPTPNGTQFYGIPMATLIQILPGMVGRRVVDKTGLTGFYDLAFPDLKRVSMPTSSPPDGADESIFTVLQDALGLRFEPAKGQVDLLVIDHLERPTEN
jgi:uncharacterized protein (TIGR03435 family)